MVATPQSALPTPRPSSQGFFKVGFWILGISDMLGLLERVVNLFIYHFHFGSVYILGFLVGTVFDAVFIVIYCRFLARRRYTGLLWLALALSILGGIVAPFVTGATAYRYSMATRGFLFFVDGIAFASGIPLGSLVSPFTRLIGIGSGIWIAVILLDTIAKIFFYPRAAEIQEAGDRSGSLRLSAGMASSFRLFPGGTPAASPWPAALQRLSMSRPPLSKTHFYGF